MIIQRPIFRKRRGKRFVPRGTVLFRFHVEQDARATLYHSIGGPVDPRMTSLMGNSVISDSRPAKRASRYSAAATPAPRAGMRRLVSIGDTQRAKGVSPKPMIDIRPGTSMP